MSVVLDVVERLLVAAQHPDTVTVERYGPGEGPWGPTVETSKARGVTGVRVVHQSSATASLWEADQPGAQAVEAPEVIPVPRADKLAPQMRAPRLLIFTAQLLDVARPAQFQSWQLLTLPDLGVEGQEGLPFGLGITGAGGGRMLLRASATGPTVGEEPAVEPFPEYVIPAGLGSAVTA